MTHPAIFSGLRLVAAVALVAAAPLAMAHGDSNVSWSVTLGSPGVYAYAPPPPVVYVQPQPVYVRPAPVYVQPATVIQYGQPYYVEGYRRGGPPGHWRHHHRDWR